MHTANMYVMTVVEFHSVADKIQYILHPNELPQRIFERERDGPAARGPSNSLGR